MIRLAEDYGRYLAGRGIAAVVREAAKKEMSEQGTVVIDFEGVRVATPSFADELFAGLLAELGPQELRDRVTVVGARPEVGRWIRHALERKSRQLHASA